MTGEGRGTSGAGPGNCGVTTSTCRCESSDRRPAGCSFKLGRTWSSDLRVVTATAAGCLVREGRVRSNDRLNSGDFRAQPSPSIDRRGRALSRDRRGRCSSGERRSASEVWSASAASRTPSRLKELESMSGSGLMIGRCSRWT
eukprot:1626790-Rhodomonas_salina.1